MTEQPAAPEGATDAAPASDSITVEKTTEDSLPTTEAPVTVLPPTGAGDAPATTDPSSSAPSQGTASLPGTSPEGEASATTSESPESEPGPTGDASGGAATGEEPAPLPPSQQGGSFTPQHLLGKVVVRLDHVLAAVDGFIKSDPELDNALIALLHEAIGRVEQHVLLQSRGAPLPSQNGGYNSHLPKARVTRSHEDA